MKIPLTFPALMPGNIDYRNTMAPFTMHLYNFLNELLERFIADVTYIGERKLALCFEVTTLSREAYDKLLKPVCEKYGLVCTFYGTEETPDTLSHAVMGLPSVEQKLCDRVLVDAKYATSLYNVRARSVHVYVLRDNIEEAAKKFFIQYLWGVSRAHSSQECEIYPYVRGPHPEVMKCLALKEVTDAHERNP